MNDLNKDKIKEIAKNSKFTVNFTEENLGFMNISAVAITAIIPEKGYYQALYNNPKNDLDITNKLLNKLEKMGIYEERLYGKDTGVFSKHLTIKGFKQCLNEYNEIKNTKMRKNLDMKTILPKQIQESGLKEMRKEMVKNKGNRNN